MIMLSNYLKIAIRNLKRHKGYSAINIAGLAVGMASALLITLWVQHELSYDKFHVNANELCRIITKDEKEPENSGNYNCALMLPTTLKDNYPEIADFSRLIKLSSIRSCQVSYVPVQNPDARKIFKEEWFFLADPSFFRMFTFPFSKGNPQTALSSVDNIVITEKTAEKYFGDEDPMGKVVNLNGESDLTVAGVIGNIPDNSSLKFDFIAPIQIMRGYLKTWAVVGPAFIQLEKGASFQEVEKKIYGAIEKYGPERLSGQRVTLQPMRDIHLNAGLGSSGNKNYVYIFSIVAVFILAIACINFMNLSTARSGIRAKEIGLRKVLGVYPPQLIRQFLTESVFMSSISLALGLVLLEIFLPIFRGLTARQLEIHYFDNFIVLPGLIGFAILVGVAAGVYPAFVISSFQPVNILKGLFTGSPKRSTLRTILVVLQFSISILLIVATTIVYKQLNFILTKDLGFDREQVLSIPISDKYKRKYDTLKRELGDVSDVINITTSNSLPVNIDGFNPVSWEGKSSDDPVYMSFVSVDYDYIETMKMEIVKGRSFSRKFAEESSSFIINEAGQKLMGMDDPIGKIFSLQNRKGRIIGVVKDFNFASLKDKIQPLVMTFAPGWYFSPYFLIKIKIENLSGTLENLRHAAKRFDPDYPFEYRFLDDAFNEMYRSEEQLGRIFVYFAILAIFISCLGLFGMASFMTESRTKEIGVRKILGASVAKLIFSLSREFIKWVLAANIIAWPVAYFMMSKWLQNFTYRIDISIWIFLMSAILALFVAFLTVSFQSIRAATANPVDSLRYE
jgi:putative ABC transport system permease protein